MRNELSKHAIIYAYLATILANIDCEHLTKDDKMQNISDAIVEMLNRLKEFDDNGERD